MKALTAKVVKTLTLGTRLVCADNSGAKELEIISIRKFHGRRGRNPKAGIGDVVIASVKKGTPEMRKKVVKAVIIRQKKAYRRPDGTRIMFEDNAAVLVDPEKKIPVGTEIKGAVAREVSDRFPKVVGIASIVV